MQLTNSLRYENNVHGEESGQKTPFRLGKENKLRRRGHTRLERKQYVGISPLFCYYIMPVFYLQCKCYGNVQCQPLLYVRFNNII